MNPLLRALLVATIPSLTACAANSGDTLDAPDRPVAAKPPLPEASRVEPTLKPPAKEDLSAKDDLRTQGLSKTGSAPPDDEAEPAVSPRCPNGMARIEGYCIDRFEAHLVTRGPEGELTAHPYYERPEEGVSYIARSVAGAFPQAYVSRVEAESACANARKRLCTRREWQRACKGSNNTTYPYGARFEAGRCNAEKAHLLTLRFGGDPGKWTYASFNDPSLDREPGFLSRTADYERCGSEDGVYDLVGNLHEWVSDTASATFRAHLEAEGIPRAFQYWSPGNGVFMGGFYSTHGELGPGCDFTTIAHEPKYHDYSTGFRCCADAE